MGFLPKRGRGTEPQIDMTPMVDCVFLLLIFFMISTAFVETPEIAIKLPEASKKPVASAPKEIKIYLAQDGTIFHQNRPVTVEQLQALLRQAGADAGQTTFLLLADRDAKHGRVVTLMDLAQSAGISKLAIATEQRRDGGKR